MAYGFTLSGYSSQCTGRIVPVPTSNPAPTTNPTPTRSPPDSTPVDSSQLMTLTVLASINLSILLINSTCLLCSKFHIADRIMGNSNSMKMTRLTEQ
ncbi:hypothetical protein EB796_015895 [Bugula neritina]|uniref:Uncharacterized protein n=1 Tax=Bugula neritina TaxID=10212 RepID=A0A7J7JJ45_BUGNE|nr:hypothetical protein EB796_015895 [Bugula neritina]